MLSHVKSMFTCWVYHLLLKKKASDSQQCRTSQCNFTACSWEYLPENISELPYVAQTFTDLHVSKAIDKFIEMRQVLTDCEVSITTKVKLVSSFIWNKVYE